MSYPKFPISSLGGKDFITQLITDEGKLHSHEFFEFSYVVHGKVKHRLPDMDSYLTSSTLVIARPQDVHAFDEGNNSNDYHRDIIVTTELFKSVCDFISPSIYEKILNCPSIIFCNLQHSSFKLLEDRLAYYSTTEKQNPELAKSIIFSVLSIIINTFLTNVSSEQLNTSDIFLHILQTMSSPHVLQSGIPALLKELNYSHGHMCRIIKACSGKTLLGVLTEKRMEHAANLLKTTDNKLTDIAAAVGYESLSHFVSVFKKEIGISPIKYKKNSTFNHTKAQLFGAKEK